MLLKMAQTKPKAEEETVFPCTLTLCRPRILAGKSRSGKIGTWEHALTVSQSPESAQGLVGEEGLPFAEVEWPSRMRSHAWQGFFAEIRA